MTRLRISTHFIVEEFDCHDGTRVPTEALPALRSLAQHWLEPLRERFGPVRVVSGYRPPRYNARVGGAPRSYHLYDRLDLGATRALGGGMVAADVVPARGRPRDWSEWARSHRLTWTPLERRSRGGVGRYDRSGFVHLDTGPRRSWEG